MFLLAAGCIASDSPTSPSVTAVAPNPALIPSAADGSAQPVNRIRAVARTSPEGEVLGDLRFDVDPRDAEWTLDITLPGAPERAVVVLTLFLLHVDEEDTESVEFSGEAGPFSLVPGQTVAPDVPIVRGPLDNLYVTGVSIVTAPDTLIEGESADLMVDVMTGQPASPDVFWTSLDTAILRMVGVTASGILPGSARVVASAGAFADTVTVVVRSNDLLPPTVLSTSPVDGAIDVSQAAAVTAVFDEDLDPGSVTPGTFRLVDSLAAPVPGSVSYADRVATFTPDAPLDTLHRYTATLETGVRDVAGNALGAPVAWSFQTSAGVALLQSFNPGLGSIVAIAFDPVAGTLFVYDDFGTVIQELDTDGTPVPPTIPHPGVGSNDIDLDFLPVGVDIGGSSVPANTLLVYDGETGQGELFAVDKDDGTLLAAVTTQIGSQTVGGAFHVERGTFFGVNWSTDRILEMDLATGDTLSSFPVAPVGGPAFDVFFGDIDIDQTSGNVLVVSSTQNTIRVLSPTGVFIRDVPLDGAGVAGMSGIAWDDARRTAWITSTSGQVYHVGGIPVS